MVSPSSSWSKGKVFLLKCSVPCIEQKTKTPEALYCNKSSRNEKYNFRRDVEDNADQEPIITCADLKKISFCFTYESRDTLKSVSLFLSVKVISKLDMQHSVKFKLNFKNFPSWYTFSRHHRIWLFYVVLQTTSNYKELKHTYTFIVLPIKPFN